jgi:hypothetical protein
MMQVGFCESTRGNTHADISCKSHHVNTAARVAKNSHGKFNRLNCKASCNLHHTSLQVDSRKQTFVAYMQLCVHTTGECDQENILNMERALSGLKHKV